jgi:luciferase family oxidoreductase group 1
MIPFSMLELGLVRPDCHPGQALGELLDLARLGEALGYQRFWLGETHGASHIVCSATTVLMGLVAAATTTIRVGAGGILLPNHVPLVVAEQAGTLEAAFPGRIDLGLGRSAGATEAVARALHRKFGPEQTGFRQDVEELLGYCEPGGDRPVAAVPCPGRRLPVWILGSRPQSAKVAADLGLPYALAGHLGPEALLASAALYRDCFRPSQRLREPRLMVSLYLVAAGTDREAQALADAAIRVGLAGPGPSSVPAGGYSAPSVCLAPHGAPGGSGMKACAVVGSRWTVASALKDLAAALRPDELILVSGVLDPRARSQSFQIAAEICARLL